MATNQQIEEFWTRTLSVSSKVVGGLAGAATAVALQNPFVGAALSPFITHNLEKVGKEVMARMLAPRQEARAGRALVAAALEIRTRQAGGDVPRDDGFFLVDEATDRSSAEEITEAVLQAAMHAAEERKVDYIASLIASISFNSAVDVATAHLMIGMAGDMTYRQLVLLRLVGEAEIRTLSARGRDNEPAPPPRLHPLMAEIFDMHRRGLIELKDRAEANDSYAVLGVDEIDPCKLFPSPLGTLLRQHMRLAEMPSDDETYSRTFDALRELARYGQGSPSVINGGEY